MSLMQSPSDFLKSTTDYQSLDIRRLQQECVGGRAQPTDITANYLSSIDELNPRIKAFVEIDREGAWCAATIADRRFQQGSPRALEGVCVAASANIALRGLEHSAGMDARRRIVAQNDAHIVTRLREAGAIFLGSTNLDEGGIGLSSDNPFFGKCMNPHGIGRSPGGAAGGAAAAVAAGLCNFAIASDTIGDARIPAAHCGTFALRPTYGAVFDTGMTGVCARFDVVGPIARSLDDLQVICEVLYEMPRDFAARDARFMRLSDPGATECDMAVIDAYASAALLPEVMTLPYSLGRLRTAANNIALREFIINLVALGEERCERISDRLAARIEDNMRLSDAELQEDRSAIDAAARKLIYTLNDNGLLVLPTTPQTSRSHGLSESECLQDFATIATIAGLPAMTIPMGIDQDGMPIGIQIVGPARSEALLFREARKINEAMNGYVQPALMGRAFR